MVPTRVLQHRPKVKELAVPYPMIALKDWASYMLEHHSSFVLGGKPITDESHLQVYQDFWHRYQPLDPDHPLYQHHPPNQWGRCVPYMVHGDEGRGKSRDPILIQSFQMLVGPAGVDSTNMSG